MWLELCGGFSAYQVARKVNVSWSMASLIALFGENVCENKTSVGKARREGQKLASNDV